MKAIPKTKIAIQPKRKHAALNCHKKACDYAVTVGIAVNHARENRAGSVTCEARRYTKHNTHARARAHTRTPCLDNRHIPRRSEWRLAHRNCTAGRCANDDSCKVRNLSHDMPNKTVGRAVNQRRQNSTSGASHQQRNYINTSDVVIRKSISKGKIST